VGIGAASIIGFIGLVGTAAESFGNKYTYAAQTSTLLVGALGFALCAWRYALHPSVRLDSTGVTVHNPLRRVEIDWPTWIMRARACPASS
jgi:hypothetical protein